jgi:large subunit ribosomal protein L19
MNPTIQKIASRQLITNRDHFKVGDCSEVYVKVREGDKERIQIFMDIMISKNIPGSQELL